MLLVPVGTPVGSRRWSWVP